MRNLFAAVLILVVLSVAAFAAPPTACTTIQSGLLQYQTGAMAGQPITTGVNPYGYNYQAHSFNGTYFNVYAAEAGFPPYSGDDTAYLAANPAAEFHWAWPYRAFDVAMKWNDAWLSNQDCDHDGALDRHYGYTSYIGSGAWLTNHNSWTVTVGGKSKNANEFIKIVANPANSTIAGPTTYFGELTVYLNGSVVGAQLWGEMAVIQYVLNDPSTGDYGVMLKSEIAAGFGIFKP